MASSGSWIPALEGLRGLASLIIVFRHAVGGVGIGIAARRSLVEGPLAPLFNADGAIAIFFVLSGTVLAGSLHRSAAALSLRATAKFWWKRIARIHLPYVAAVGLAWACSVAYQVPPQGEGLSPWLRHLASIQISTPEFLRALLFPGTASLQLPVG